MAERGGGEALLGERLDRLEATVKGVNEEAERLLEMDLSPYSGNEESMTKMRDKLREWLVQNTIKSDPPIRDAVARSLKKRGIPDPTGSRVGH